MKNVPVRNLLEQAMDGCWADAMDGCWDYLGPIRLGPIRKKAAYDRAVRVFDAFSAQDLWSIWQINRAYIDRGWAARRLRSLELPFASKA